MFTSRMKSSIKKTLTTASLFFILFPSFAIAAELEAPVINEIEKTENTRLIKPIISGIVEKDVKVLVYVDGIYSGDAIQKDLNAEKNEFTFKSKEYYKTGEHKIVTVAKKEEESKISTSSNEIIFETLSLPAPTLIELIEKEGGDYILAGLSQNNTKVEFYLDEKIIGTTESLIHKSGTASFAFKFSADLKKGQHQILAIATDQSGFKSKISNRIKFTAKSELPAPVLLNPIITNNKTTIVGLIKNDLDVKLFVNGEEIALIKIDNHESGTANFAYEIEKQQIEQEVKVRAVKNNIEESKFSKSIIINKKNVVIPKITPKAVTEDLSAGALEREENPTVKGIEKIFEKDVVAAEKESGVETIISGDKLHQEENKKTGALNESGQDQFKLSLNLVIFMLFLLSVIVWILWVNKELIKERKEAESKKTDLSAEDLEQEEEKAKESETTEIETNK